MSEKYSKEQPNRQAPGGDANPTHDNMVREAKVFKAVEGVGFFSGPYATSHNRGTGQMECGENDFHSEHGERE